jgi:hypothetical protein
MREAYTSMVINENAQQKELDLNHLLVLRGIVKP